MEVAMPARKLFEFLDTNKIKYTVITHSTAYTSMEIASISHVPGQELAKTVMVELDGALAMAVLPASYQVDLGALQTGSGATKARLASEIEFKGSFPDCEAGAMPPFGNLYGMKVFVDEGLSKDKEIAFNACSHKELVRMSYDDFATLAKPTLLKFATKKPRVATADDRLW
jgi:Ala-tRNA(Pro) deacylase